MRNYKAFLCSKNVVARWIVSRLLVLLILLDHVVQVKIIHLFKTKKKIYVNLKTYNVRKEQNRSYKNCYKWPVKEHWWGSNVTSSTRSRIFIANSTSEQRILMSENLESFVVNLYTEKKNTMTQQVRNLGC